MQKHHVKNTVCAALALALTTTAAFADKLAENNYAFAEVGMYDMDYYGSGFSLGAGYNHNVMERIDAIGELGYSSLSEGMVDASLIQGSAKGRYWFMPDNMINPYAGAGLAFRRVSSEVEYMGHKAETSSSEFGFEIFGGAEFDLMDKLFLRAEINMLIIDGESDIGVSVTGGYLVTDNIYATGKVQFGDINKYLVGAVYKF